MNRRAVLTGTGAALSATVGGCLTSATERDPETTEDSSPRITATEPNVVPGEKTVLVVKSSKSSQVYVSNISAEAVEFDFDDVDVSPSPSGIYSMHPPVWFWDNPTTVELRLPVTASDDVEPGEYQYRVRAFTESPVVRSNASESPAVSGSPDDLPTEQLSVDEEFTITVVES